MKFALPITAIVLTLVAAYFTLSQSEKFEKIQTQRLENKATNARILANLSETQDSIDVEKETLKEVEQQLLVAKARVSTTESDTNAIKNKVADLDASLASQNAQFAQLQGRLDKLKEQLGDDITLENIAAKAEEVEDELKEKREKIEELETLIVGAESNLDSNVEEMKQLANRIRVRSERIALNSMEARISAVDQDWGFVVIAAGSNSGFAPQTSLLVMRNGDLIGRVKPSAIEPTQTIAEIDFKTLAPGARIQPGDKVILAKPAVN